MSLPDGPPNRPPKILIRPPGFPPGLPGWLLLCATSVGALLRLNAAAHGGLWRDEALFLFVSRLEPMGRLIDFLHLHESHPPGFYLLMRWWSDLLGRSESAAVGLSLALGIGLIPLVYHVGSRLFGSRMGVFAAALTAVSPPLIQLSILVRPYALLAVLCVLTVYLLWECLRGEGKGSWLLYGLATIVMLYVHNWTLLLYGAHVVIGVVWLATRRSGERNDVLRPWVLTQLVILLFYAPWVPVLMYQLRHAGHGPSPSMTTGPYVVAVKILAGTRLAYLGLVLLASLLAGLLGWRRSRILPRGHDLLGIGILTGIPLIVIASAALLSSKTALLPPWCVAVLSPLAALLLARFLAWVYETGARRGAYAAGAVLLILYVLTWHFDPENIKSNARETAMAIAARVAPGDLVIVTPESIASSFNYYFRANNQQIDYPSPGREYVVRYDDRFRRMTSERALRQAFARIDTARAHGRRVWLVMESGDVADRFVRPLAAADTARDYLHPLARKRSNQLRQHLERLYGSPKLTIKPVPGQEALELLSALLFEPATSKTASMGGRIPCQIIVPVGRADSEQPQADPQLCLR